MTFCFSLYSNLRTFSKGPNWQPYAVEDGLLITGQNPASSKLVAGQIISKIKKIKNIIS